MRTLLWTTVAHDELQRELAEFGAVTVIENRNDVASALAGCDALVMSNPANYNEEIAELVRKQRSTLRWIQFLSAGYEGIARYGAPSGITITNAGDCWSPTVAEHGMMLLLALARSLPDCLAAQGRASWNGDLRNRLSSLEDRTLLVIGFGSIGREITRRAKGFGMRVIGLTRSGQASPQAEIQADEMVPATALIEALGCADAIIVALPLSSETYHFIGRPQLAVCRRNAILINVSRGGVIDPVALDEALREKRIAGAGLDVTEPEPLPFDNPLWHAPNLIITPHIAGFGSPALALRLAALVHKNARRFEAGAPLLHQVRVPILA